MSIEESDLKVLLQEAGFHNTDSPYMAAGTLANFNKLIEALAVRMVNKRGHMYTPGDLCPMCGYDAYWNCETKEESVALAFDAMTA